jgi:hypothetical protein
MACGQHVDFLTIWAMEVSENGDITGKSQENGQRNGAQWI